MNILFLTLVNIKSFDEKQNIYSDLCRELISRGHSVYIVCPDEAGAEAGFTSYGESGGILKVRTGRVQKTSLIKKGIATLLLGRRFKNAIKKYIKGVKFDAVVYSTPPITLYSIVKYVKKRDRAFTYLLLKDIFPQNARDLGMMSGKGIKAPIYVYFKMIEKRLYAISDAIGCMSGANVNYLIKNEPNLPKEKIHINPNSIEPDIKVFSEEEKLALRQRYNLPLDKKIFIYGGNVGKPQGIPFVIECMRRVSDNGACHFVICGSGTELSKLQSYREQSGQENLTVIPGLPKDEYENFVGCCDVGLIFLDYRFTIPNLPSRLLSYMQKSMPVIACTDTATDIGKIISDGGFGIWCPSNDIEMFNDAVSRMLDSDMEKMGERAGEYLVDHYNVAKSADIIIKSCGEVKK